MLHGAIETQLAAPPAAPLDGQCWLVAGAPSGAWAGHADEVAAFAGGNWLFLKPRDGMRLFNRATRQDLRFNGNWKAPTRPTPTVGGTIVDAEVRNSLAALVQCLADAGVLPLT